MAEMKIVKYSKQSYRDPIAIVGFPGVGLVGSILTGYIVRTLEMEVIAAITSPDFPPYALIQNGNPYPPIRVYGCKRESTSDYCGDLIIITSEITMKPEQYYELSATLTELFKKMGIKYVIALEGIPRFNGETGMFACGSVCASRERIDMLELKGFDEGMIRGLTGVMLYEAFISGADVTVIMCPANPALPDPRAAAQMLEPLSKLVPELKIDPEPLYKEAEEIENKIMHQGSDIERAPRDIQQLYG